MTKNRKRWSCSVGLLLFLLVDSALIIGAVENQRANLTQARVALQRASQGPTTIENLRRRLNELGFDLVPWPDPDVMPIPGRAQYAAWLVRGVQSFVSGHEEIAVVQVDVKSGKVLSVSIESGPPPSF